MWREPRLMFDQREHKSVARGDGNGRLGFPSSQLDNAIDHRAIGRAGDGFAGAIPAEKRRAIPLVIRDMNANASAAERADDGQPGW